MKHPLLTRQPVPEYVKREAEALLDTIYDLANHDDCERDNLLRTLCANAVYLTRRHEGDEKQPYSRPGAVRGMVVDERDRARTRP